MALLLPKSLILHIPKTGSAWVRSACDAAVEGPIEEVGDWHCDLSTAQRLLADEGLPTFVGTFVRQPLEWYKSAWCYWQDTGRFPRGEDEARVETEDFEQFVRNCMKIEPNGYVTTMYERYVGRVPQSVEFVGRRESLVEDLVRFLQLAGERFDEGRLRAVKRCNMRQPRSNGELPRYSPELLSEVLRCEQRILSRFGYYNGHESRIANMAKGDPTSRLFTSEVRLGELNGSGCQCPRAGWCERHNCRKTDHWWKLCRRRHDYFDLWEHGRGPGQRRRIESAVPSSAPRTTAVVVICHNYGRYLGDAVESVLRQTKVPDEVLVVDDRSTDETREVAERFTGLGVQYVRVDAGNVHGVRRAGFERTQSDAICFLDADDRLSEEYLERGLREFNEPRVGVVYSDVEHFGRKRGRSNYPAVYDAGALHRDNFIHAGSIVRRTAIETSGAFDAAINPLLTQADWFLWRRVLRGNWTARKQPGLYYYRQHGSNWMSEMNRGGRIDYFEYAGLEFEEVTLFVPLAGRTGAWNQLRGFLDRQEWPHEQLRIIFLDTSQDERFAEEVRCWMAGSDYNDVRCRRETVANLGLADANRRERNVRQAVVRAMWRIYSRMLEMVETEYVWVLEDDVLPPDDVCERLLRGFDVRTAAVAAPYRSRFHNRFVVWDASGQEFSTPGAGLQVVGGAGFGCTVLRRSAIRNEVLVGDSAVPDYDIAFSRRLRESSLVMKVDWTCQCLHEDFVPIQLGSAQ